MKRLTIILVSLLITGFYCAAVYLLLLAIGFDAFWSPHHYENSNGMFNIAYFLFTLAWVPCIMSVMASFFKTKIFSQDLIFYCCGLAGLFCIYFYNNINGYPFNRVSILCLLCIIGFITIYIPIFDIYLLNKISSQKDEKEKPKDKKP